MLSEVQQEYKTFSIELDVNINNLLINSRFGYFSKDLYNTYDSHYYACLTLLNAINGKADAYLTAVKIKMDNADLNIFEKEILQKRIDYIVGRKSETQKALDRYKDAIIIYEHLK